MTGSSPPNPSGVLQITFPALFHAADSAAAENQKRLLRLRKVELVALAMGAAVSELSGKVLAGVGPALTVACFLAALLLRVSGWDQEAERRWYDARAAAESCKSLSWQFAAGGEAFRITDEGAQQRFTHELRTILHELPDLDFPASTSAVVTPEMAALRTAGLKARVATYTDLRVEDQRSWYSAKADWNRRRALQWRAGLIATEALAAGLGIGRVLGWIEVDWLSIFAALAAVIAAWQQTKNYSGLGQSYAVTSHDVTLVLASLDASSEESWSQAVHDSEAAFSREHTLWRARKQGPIR